MEQQDQPVSLAKVDDCQYQQQQQQYQNDKDQIIQQQLMIIQQQQQQLQFLQTQSQQQQLEQQQLQYQQIQAQQQQLEQQQLQLQQLQYQQIQAQHAQLQSQVNNIDPKQLEEYQKQLFLQPPSLISNNNVATINPNAEPAQIANGVLHAPNGSEFVGDQMKGSVKVRIIRGHNLMVADSISKSSDPYVKIKSSCFVTYPQTKFVSNNLNPQWEETFYLTVESVRTELLMFKVYDHDYGTCDDLLGYFGINLSLLPIGIPIKTNEKLYFAKHGTIEIEVTAQDFGLTNIPSNYCQTYIQWRENINVLERKEFKSLPSNKKPSSSYISSRDIPMGPYYCKITHGDFKIIHGHPKMRKTSRAKFADGLATAGLITAAIFAVIITAPLSSCNHHW